VTMSRLGLLALVLAASTIAVHAQQRPGSPPPPNTRGTPDDQRACRSDAVKLCREVIDNDMAVLSCFQQNRSKLTRACAAVLRKYGQ
jgi:hypothetical protein